MNLDHLEARAVRKGRTTCGGFLGNKAVERNVFRLSTRATPRPLFPLIRSAGLRPLSGPRF